MTTPAQPPDQSKIVLDAVAPQMLQLTNVNVNVAQELIVTTEDKVRLCLNEYLAALEQPREWIAPAGIFVTLIVTLTTASFEQVLLLSKDTWRALFVIAAVGSLAWLVRSLFRLFSSPCVADIVAQMKKGSVVQQTAARGSSEVTSQTDSIRSR